MNLMSNVQTVQGWFEAVVLITVFGLVFVAIIVLSFLFYRGVLIF